MRTPALISVLVISIVLTACSAPSPTSTPEPTESAASEPTRTDVDWENYSTDVKRLIDEDTVAQDCEMLQGAFDVADTADDAQRDRTGDGNADLMGYIDESLELAGCYE